MLNRKLLVRLFFLWVAVAATAQDRPDALREYRSGNFEGAAAICKEELAADPASLESYVVLGWSLLKLGRYQEAKRYALDGRAQSRYDPRLVQILGESEYQLGRNAAALEYLKEYVNLAPEGGRIDVVYYLMAEIFIRLGKFRHADIALSTAVRYVDGDSLWWTRLGYARESAGDLREAVVAYERALALDPGQADARRGLERTRRALGIR